MDDGLPAGLDGIVSPWVGGWPDIPALLRETIPDRVARTKALGNSLVPIIPELIGRAILDYEAEGL